MINPLTVVILETKLIGNTIEQHESEKITTTFSPFPKRLMITKPSIYLEFDIVGELKIMCIKIALLQAIRDIPIYAKMIKELCGKRPRRKRKDPPTVHVVGTLSDLILGKQVLVKYEDPGSLVVTIQIQGYTFPNTLVVLGAIINLMNYEPYNVLGITTLKPTSTLLELADRLVIKSEGTLEDITASVDS